MRGRLPSAPPPHYPYGTTPAYAGKTFLCEKGAGAGGPPPRMRGRLRQRLGVYGPAGTTPAYAGKTWHRHVRHWCSWDHPRVCGEDRIVLALSCSSSGPPPRMRGRLHGVPGLGDGVGTTPRMRGRHLVGLDTESDEGTTPAYAGKTRHCEQSLRFSRDHPRVCGEDTTTGPPRRTAQGPPPRMRGRHRRANRPRPRTGTTPAYAGKTPTTPRYLWPGGDHPRVCGEDINMRAPLAAP